MTREEIIQRYPLVTTMEGRGAVLRGTGTKLLTNRCGSTSHKIGHNCVNVDTEKQIWYCNDCKQGGSVIDFMARFDGIEPVDILKRFGTETGSGHSNGSSLRPSAPQEAAKKAARPQGVPVATYNYTDEKGDLLFCVCRFEPKDFRQKAPDGTGGWIYKLEGIRRVIYNLPRVLAADFVWVVEGEKDANTLNTAKGFVATTNCGGAEKWTEEYSKSLRGKDVAIIPDNDAKGEAHLDVLKKSLAPFVKSMRVIRMPDGFKDVTEYVESFEEKGHGLMAVLDIADKAEVLYKGESLPVQTMEEMEEEYRAHIARSETHRLTLGSWIPAFWEIRPLVPGELVSVLAGTGCGKTMLLQNIAINTRLPTLLFEVELPSSLSFERFAAMATENSGSEVEKMYKEKKTANWKVSGKLNHITCVHRSKLTTEDIHRIITKAELKTSVRPVLVLVDYIQLVQAKGESRYERVSGVAEQLKVVAKETNTIIVMASQIGRGATGESKEVTLTDAKESGSIENSSGLVIGAWRDGDDPDRMWLRVLKNTKGKSGRTVPCRIHESLKISQEAQETDQELVKMPVSRTINGRR